MPFPNGNAQNLASANGIRFFLKAEGNLPKSVQFVTINQYNEVRGTATVNIAGTDVENGAWIYLEPKDFVDSNGAALTAFTNTLAFGFKITGNGQDDGYKAYDMYLSGLSQYVKPIKNPAPTDNYIHTYLPGIEEAEQALLDTTSKTSNVSLTAGITDTKYVANGANSAVKISLNGKVGWGQLFFYKEESSSSRLPFPNGNAQKLASADGIRFFLKAEGNLPKSVQFVTVDQYNGLRGTATVNISGTDVEDGAWIYLEPKDFVDSNGAALTTFTNTLAFGFKITSNDQGDGYKAYDMYLSGISQYVKPSLENMRAALLGTVEKDNVRHNLNGDEVVDIRDLVWLADYMR